MTKSEMLREAVRVLKTDTVSSWYDRYLKEKNQDETLMTLLNAIGRKELTAYQALCIAFVVGFQWHIKFEGVN